MSLKTKVAAAMIGFTGLAAIVAGAGCGGQQTTAPSAQTAAQHSIYIPAYVSAEHAIDYETLVRNVHDKLLSGSYVVGASDIKEDAIRYMAFREVFEIKYSDGTERYFVELSNISDSRVMSYFKEDKVEALSYAWVEGKMGDPSSIVSIEGKVGNADIYVDSDAALKELDEIGEKLKTSFTVNEFISDLQSAAPYGAGRDFVVK